MCQQNAYEGKEYIEYLRFGGFKELNEGGCFGCLALDLYYFFLGFDHLLTHAAKIYVEV
jgi:hypothetical protein